ncbi:MAG: flavin reductase family protein [Clostridiales bacterium]|nr:flavin reductase family protein [Clostridiales bacterium]
MSNEFKQLQPNQLNENTFKLLGTDWAILTATDRNGLYNGMTISWGGLGFLWNKPVFTCYIRPQRYTYELARNADNITLSFFDEKYRSALRLFGAKSGRDLDKAATAGLTPITDDAGTYYEEARLVIVGKILYSDMLKKDAFLDSSLLTHYQKDDFHRMYICEISDILTKD